MNLRVVSWVSASVGVLVSGFILNALYIAHRVMWVWSSAGIYYALALAGGISTLVIVKRRRALSSGPKGELIVLMAMSWAANLSLVPAVAIYTFFEVAMLLGAHE